MRSSILILVLVSLLVALVHATKINPLTDYVSISHPDYRSVDPKGYAKYSASKAGACINVHRAFNKRNTFVFTHGRSVELFARPNCQSRFAKTKTNTSPVMNIHAIMSFKVGSK
ncbi:hypothetical protein GGI20_005235 [Coemansia sp. BCRC 34301]|nr:hypothetical protein GGI20_005235 [Coemansia sp. BCRC 34301]